MSDPDEIHKHDLIEAAINRSLGEVSNSSIVLQEGRILASRREQDQAIKRRLEQLEAAQGSLAACAPVELHPASVHLAPELKGRSFSSGALLFTAFVAAFGGAGLAWLMTGVAMRDSQHKQVIAPVSVAPADTPVSTSPVLNVATAATVSVTSLSKNDESQSQVRDLVEEWRLAWQHRDIEAYLRYYGPQFVPPYGQTRSDWNRARQRNFSSRSNIRLDIKKIRIERIDENIFKVSFLQDYASGAYHERSHPKMLLIERNEKQWQIAGEFQLSALN
ncbi:nuclear transport factor 2 family protein [Rhodoferax sp.]|uniref:nuclear transport factor 2 family protein n=1 Tax=Rhodoferax sp. TaxID=50421 RepID=UPI00284931D3|nr:nuclear transport factor 2 family protein [Rhodoferax sp.]MDR3368091.1 nuclear transport factor 2 family protein [Rhodoferax sp.]